MYQTDDSAKFHSFNFNDYAVPPHNHRPVLPAEAAGFQRKQRLTLGAQFCFVVEELHGELHAHISVVLNLGQELPQIDYF